MVTIMEGLPDEMLEPIIEAYMLENGVKNTVAKFSRINKTFKDATIRVIKGNLRAAMNLKVTNIFNVFPLETLINMHLKMPEVRKETTRLLTKITEHVEPYKTYLYDIYDRDEDGSLMEDADHIPGGQYGHAGNVIDDLRKEGVVIDTVINNLYLAVDQHPFSSAYRGAEW